MLEDKREDVSKMESSSSGSHWGDSDVGLTSEHGSVIGMGSEQVERKGV